MRWSYADLMDTPEPVVDAVAEWMLELAEEERRRQREIENRRNRR
jgi:hypothetical protein